MANNLLTRSVTVSTAGTRVQVSASSIRCRSAVIQAKYNNAGTIFVGSSNVAASNGFALAAREAFNLGELDLVTGENSYDLTAAWVDATNNGDIVVIAYIPY